MATKTFKIGLSNTDKQNMAQDVYERLLALTFPEYDSAESYDVGDFVVYNDQLYKCIGATSGAWDSTKWQLATLNDLLTDIEDAVQFVNDKANVDGNYPTMTVGVADQLSPYDDESGDDQDEPFSFQATGTGNGTQPDFSTGAIALLKEKQGNTVVVNQLVVNGNFASTSGWNGSNCTLSASNNILSATLTSTTGSKEINRPLSKYIQGHKYLYLISINTPKTGTIGITISNLTWSSYTSVSRTISTANTFIDLAILVDATFTDISGTAVLHIYPFVQTAEVDDTVQLKNFSIIDLTQWFNGDIPQDLLDNPSNFYRYYQGSLAYNTGELVNANGRYIKCIGRNQWDEEWENCYWDSTGKHSNANYVGNKTLIKVIPNATYYAKTPVRLDLMFYDQNGNFINHDDNVNNDTFTTPSNCAYIGFANYSSGSLTTYANNITISLYYEDESGYDQYYPYEVLTNNDTGTEVLLAFDKKTPDGTWYKNTRKVSGTDLQFVRETEQGLNLYRIGRAKSESQKIKNSFGLPLVASFDSTTETKEVIQFASVGQEFIYVLLNTSRTLADFVMEYELADAYKTTEQGTSFSENLVIDDFGSMDFSGTNGVPQGNLIFYPVDYKAFIDTLYDYTEGTPSNIALKSDLPTAPQTWAENLPGYDATKTQTLKNVEGTLTWVDDE